LALASCTSVTPYYRYETKITELNAPPDIQVLLTDFKNSDSITLSLKGKYHIFSYSPIRTKHFISGRVLAEGNTVNNLVVRTVDGSIKIGEMNLSSGDIVIKPADPVNLIKISGPGINRSYRGMIRINNIANKLVVSNIVDLESYLYSVVGSEMYSKYPTYALSAQAIASRTFALFRIKQNYSSKNTSSKLFGCDATDDIFTQVYRGEERVNNKTMEAVNNSKGVVLEFNGKIIYSIFHDTCGGATESGNLVFQLTHIPPLAGRICGFCYDSKYNNWNAVLTEKEIIKELGLESVSKIDAIIPLQKAPGGHITSIGIKVPERTADIVMDAQKFRIALDPNKVRSTKFEVVKNGDKFEFKGNGWGHAVGMCQEGARGMAIKDFDTLQILEYYYPESRVVKIY
jgi:stage II sporulation protein D